MSSISFFTLSSNQLLLVTNYLVIHSTPIKSSSSFSISSISSFRRSLGQHLHLVHPSFWIGASSCSWTLPSIELILFLLSLSILKYLITIDNCSCLFLMKTLHFTWYLVVNSSMVYSNGPKIHDTWLRHKLHWIFISLKNLLKHTISTIDLCHLQILITWC